MAFGSRGRQKRHTPTPGVPRAGGLLAADGSSHGPFEKMVLNFRSKLRHLAESTPRAARLAFQSHPDHARGRTSGDGGKIVNAGPEIKNIVLVHGGFVDGSGRQGVYEHLTADGYRVSVVQNPTLSLAGDVAATRMILDRIDGPAVLVGHSYGGAVITEAGNHPNVAALAYITAFAPDKGESVNSLIANPPPGSGSRARPRSSAGSARPRGRTGRTANCEPPGAASPRPTPASPRSRRSNGRSRCWRRRAAPTRRSRPGSSSPRGPSPPASTRCSPNSGSPQGPRCGTRWPTRHPSDFARAKIKSWVFRTVA
jgi:pimeloyl-ACP methyl ester carboxylesterase